MRHYSKFIAVLALASACSLVALHAEAEEVVGSIAIEHTIAKKELPSLGKIDFATAMKHALKAVPGAVIEGELEVDNGYLLYGFQIVTPEKQLIDVEIDAGNGKVLEKESGDHQDDEDDDN